MADVQCTLNLHVEAKLAPRWPELQAPANAQPAIQIANGRRHVVMSQPVVAFSPRCCLLPAVRCHFSAEPGAVVAVFENLLTSLSRYRGVVVTPAQRP